MDSSCLVCFSKCKNKKENPLSSSNSWQVMSNVFFNENLPNFDLKNMILTDIKDFPWKNGPTQSNFEEKSFQIPKFLLFQ
jgi:hypothetical protein